MELLNLQYRQSHSNKFKVVSQIELSELFYHAITT